MNKMHFKLSYYLCSNSKSSGIVEYFGADYLPSRGGQERDHADSRLTSLCLFSVVSTGRGGRG